jgi:type 1 glutamine amidotransferase
MLNLRYTILSIAIIFISISCKKNELPSRDPNGPPQILLFTKTQGFKHQSQEFAIGAIQSYFASKGVRTLVNSDSSVFTKEGLASYDAVMFLLTTGNVLGPAEEKSIQEYIRGGGGFIGVHSAADTEYDWPWYGQLLGAYFDDHTQVMDAIVYKTDTLHISTRHMAKRTIFRDEWYNFKSLPENVWVLLTVDEKTYPGGKHGDHHPISWSHPFEGGRSFYTALGHPVEMYEDTSFLEHLRMGALWAAKKSPQ